MVIDVSTTTLWAELAAWRPSALEIIIRPEHWAIRGASRMGRALTEKDRYPSDEPLVPEAIEAGRTAARRLIDLLAKTEPELASWREPAPTEGQGVTAGPAQLEGLDLLLAVAHASQAGAVEDDVNEEGLRALVAEPPRAPQRSHGAMSALLAASTTSLWIPAPLRHAWDGPFATIASMDQLRADLAALPRLLRDVTPAAASEVRAAQQLVATVQRAIEGAGAHSIRMSA